MSVKILVVDDEKDIVTLLKDYFQLNNFDVLTAYNAKEAISCINEEPDLIILDVNMPGMNGVELCKMIRNTVKCPIIFLSAKTDGEDILQGLSAGGDDYITKPFNIRELLGRVQAHLRREERTQQKAVESDVPVIDYLSMTVRFKGKEISFTKTEFAIIELLSLHPGRIFDREKIYETVRGYDAEGGNMVITEHIRKIRNKFVNAGCPPFIDTVWGVGYKWTK